MTGIYIDGSETSVLTSPVVFPGGTAGTNNVTSTTDGFRATQKIVLAFDNSLISAYDKDQPVSVDNDDKGKNKQLAGATITFTYEKVETGIKTIHTETITLDGSQPIYNLGGVKAKNADHGVFIVNGKKIVK